MQKIYLLLRNNKQTGPHSLEELLTAGLKPFDLIWVEGRSAGWRYPSEIDSLKPYLPEQSEIPQFKSPETVINQAASFPIATPVEATMKVSGKHIFVSMPSGIKQRIIEKPVEQSPIQNSPEPTPYYNSTVSVASNSSVSKEPISETRYTRSLNEVEEDYTNWVFKSKKKKSSLQLNQQTVVFGAIGVLACTIIYFGISRLVSNNTGSDLDKTVVLRPEENKTNPISTTEQINPVEKQTVIKPVSTENIPTTTLPVNSTPTESVALAPARNQRVIESGSHKSISNHTGKKSTQQALVSKKQLSQTVQQQSALQPKETVVMHEEAAPQIQKPVQTDSKKKGFSAFLNGVFGKLKKKNTPAPPVTETRSEPFPSMPSETRSNGERRSSRRSEDAQVQSESSPSRDVETVEEKDFAPQATLIELQGSERNNSWQLGVYDLKLTLYNKNTVPIRSAGVDVLYFDENNRLLEKKTVYFSNISPRGHGTVKVPDQKWADHTDYRLIALK